MDFYEAELQRLDLLLHREILRLRARYNLSLDEFRGLYVSDEQVDALVRLSQAEQASMQADQASMNADAGEGVSVEALSEQANWLRARNVSYLGENHPWARLSLEFGLSVTEMDVLLLAFAPELDARYETIYAYLNNDVNRKSPSHDLALRLFCETGNCRTSLRASLLPGGALYSRGLLVPNGHSSERLSWLAGGFSIAPAMSAFALGMPAYQAQISPCVTCVEKIASWSEVSASDALKERIARTSTFFGRRGSDTPAPILVFEGKPGAGRLAAAYAFCNEIGVPLLKLDVAALKSSGESPDATLSSLSLCARLEKAGVYVEGVEALWSKEGELSPETHALMETLADLSGPVFVACVPGAPWRELFVDKRHLYFAFTDLDYHERRRLWSHYLTGEGVHASEEGLDEIAGRFELTAGQIRSAVRTVIDHRKLLAEVMEGGEIGTSLQVSELLEAARAQSDTGLGKLAVKVATPHSWDDVVLPPATLRQAHEVASAIQHHHLVYSQWGFSRRVASGRGLKVLFAGASGTGKTMTAGVIARSLGLDLYKIDLSGVVSKYIGETEKNLDRIFEAAHNGNAILFFDEADALFGKRSEVKDAHDRYANIEVSYLLQKLEEHEGAVILASNLSHHIDRAFSRRMHYVVEFPMPDETQREDLWRGMFPAQAPLDAGVDFGFLARQFAIAGGDIQNAALDAAFLAASDGHVVNMRHLVRAMSRQMLKGGRVPSAGEFGEYYRWVGM
ncbi:MAG TPA: AAA family ATPase [Chloroflexia bacterium]|nr:AAA family ATPase [Chloroflexia bacterium]